LKYTPETYNENKRGKNNFSFRTFYCAIVIGECFAAALWGRQHSSSAIPQEEIRNAG
jgi:hypothetical protein